MLVNRFWNESVAAQGASVTLNGASRDVGAQLGKTMGSVHSTRWRLQIKQGPCGLSHR